VTTLANVDRPRKVASRAPNRRGEGELLREQLIEAASRLLAAPVVEEPLSLRAVAREVGVVPQSVYLHFSDKTQLVRAVIQRRFAELSRILQAAESSASDAAGATGKLRARCLAYCHFGLESPGHYALLFETRATGQMGIRFEGSPGAQTFDHFVTAVQRCMDAGAAPGNDAFAITTSLWTGLHGVVSLRLSKPGFPWPPLENLVDRLLTGVVGVELPKATKPRVRRKAPAK
jgi:AcrR family transcriptional regulator